MKTIDVLVSPTGETRLETKGFAGAECRQASAFLEGVLGRRTSERSTAEFYQQEIQPETQKETR